MDDDAIDIAIETFDEDFDDAGWQPEVVNDDSNEELANKFGY